MARTMTFDIHTVVGVYDGDTLSVMIDRGFYDYSMRAVRIRGIDAPELRAPTQAQGNKVRDAVIAWVKAATVGKRWLKLVSYAVEGDKYGRVVGDIVCDANGSLAKYLLANRLALPYEGGKKKVWTPEELAVVDAFVIPVSNEAKK